MSKKGTIIERNALYEEVWERSLTKVAPKYGISGVALKKICNKLNVPTPSRGYWAKLEWGHEVQRPELPELKPGDPETHEIFKRAGYMRKTQSVRFDKSDLPEGIGDVDKIKVSKTLEDPLRIIKRTEIVLGKARHDDRGNLVPRGNGVLNISVTPKQLDRALRIMDAVLKGFGSAGYKVTDDGAVEIGSVVIPVSMSEKFNRVEHVPTKAEKKKIERSPFFHGVQDWDYFPTGKLKFSFGLTGARGLQKHWADSATRKLEDLVGKIISGGVRAAKAYEEEQREIEEWRKKMAEERRIREEEARRKAEEKERLDVLERWADRWAKAERLRAFVRAVEHSGIENVNHGDGKMPVQEWVSWALRHSDGIDPLSGR